MPYYVIIYRKKGSPAGLTPWNDDLEKTKKVARDGLVRHDADEFEIRADNSDGATLWQERRDAQSPYGRAAPT